MTFEHSHSHSHSQHYDRVVTFLRTAWDHCQFIATGNSNSGKNSVNQQSNHVIVEESTLLSWNVRSVSAYRQMGEFLSNEGSLRDMKKLQKTLGAIAVL